MHTSPNIVCLSPALFRVYLFVSFVLRPCFTMNASTIPENEERRKRKGARKRSFVCSHGTTTLVWGLCQRYHENFKGWRYGDKVKRRRTPRMQPRCVVYKCVIPPVLHTVRADFTGATIKRIMRRQQHRLMSCCKIYIYYAMLTLYKLVYIYNMHSRKCIVHFAYSHVRFRKVHVHSDISPRANVTVNRKTFAHSSRLAFGACGWLLNALQSSQWRRLW